MPTDLAPIDPPLKWAGGKRWLLPRLREYYADFRERRLVEPFGGGLAVSLGLRPERALIFDGNEHLIHFFRRLQQGLVIDRTLVNEEASYYAARKRLNELIRAGMQATEEAAGLFYYLNRTCYNGLCRFNSSGEFNVPFGRYKQINYTADFGEYAPILRDWEFRFGDFEEIPLQADDFIYADPPYDVDFTRYAKNDFTWADQERLAVWLAAHPGPVVASNQATPRILELYGGLGFAVETVLAPRMIACNGDRSKAVEMLAVRGM